MSRVNERKIKQAALNSSEKFPVFKNKFPYIQSRVGILSELPQKGVNTRYKMNKTILHHEVKTCKDSDRVQVYIALIKMGANVSLRDIEDKKPLEYFKDEDVKKETLKDLNNTLNKYNKNNSIIGLRLQRAKIEFFEGDERIKVENEYIDRLNKCVNELGRKNVNWEDTINKIAQFIFKEEDKEIADKAQDVLVDFFRTYSKEEKQNDIELRLNLSIRNLSDNNTKLKLLDILYENSKWNLDKVRCLNKTLNAYVAMGQKDEKVEEDILKKFQECKEQKELMSIDKCKIILDKIEKELQKNKIIIGKEYKDYLLESVKKENEGKVRREYSLSNTKKKRQESIKKTNIEQNKSEEQSNEIEVKEIKIFVPENIEKQVRRLTPEGQVGYERCIEALKNGDTSGLNNHMLGYNRRGQWAIDIKGTGRKRGDGRIVYKKDEDGTITILEIIINHKYNS